MDVRTALTYPWLAPYYRRFAEAYRRDRVPHALLIGGMSGVGKRALAYTCAGLLLCHNVRDDDTPCGECTSCRQLANGMHPAVMLVQRETVKGKQSKVIKVVSDADGIQMRELLKAMAYTAQGWRIGMIEPAEAMNAAAANALLKMLEEPGGQKCFILIADAPTLLPITISSRCWRMLITPPQSTSLTEWWSTQEVAVADVDTSLQLTYGAPLAAKALLADKKLVQSWREELLATVTGEKAPSTVAEVVQHWTVPLILSWLLCWVQQAIRLALATAPPPDDPLIMQLAKLPAQRLYLFADDIAAAQRCLHTSADTFLLLMNVLTILARLPTMRRYPQHVFNDND